MTDSAALDPTIIVIFGITGDLSQRYLLPALYHLIKDDLLHTDTEIIGISRQPMSADDLLSKVELCVNEIDNVCDPVALSTMHDHTQMFQMDPTDASAYQRLRQKLDEVEAAKGVCMNRLYYLSIPPQVYEPIIKLMGGAGLNGSCQHDTAQTRLLVEKPFGYDSSSAEDLIDATAAVFSEQQLFRIDHYLAKETVQDILAFRVQQTALEHLWNRQHISAIEISASEQIDITGREQFYEPVGALRDFVQSHLLQILGIVTMDLPKRLESDAIHAAKQAVLEQTLPIPANRVTEQAIRAQYQGYRKQVGHPDSGTETFAGVQVSIDSERWRGVPITVWSGKALAEKRTEICVTFKGDKQPNRLHFMIQPSEGISLDLSRPQPGLDDNLQQAIRDFSEQHATDYEHPSAYERVLVDAVRGDHTLFATSGEVLAAWRIIQSVVTEWSKNASDLKPYDKGAAGAKLIQPLLT